MTENLPEDHAAELVAARHRADPRHCRGDRRGRGGGVHRRGVGERDRCRSTPTPSRSAPLPVDGEGRRSAARLWQTSRADGLPLPLDGGERGEAGEWGRPRRGRGQGAACRGGPAGAAGRRAANADEAVAAATALGFPVALKALGIAHKSEHGAVRLNLRDEASVRDAADALSALGSGLYVERMVTRRRRRADRRRHARSDLRAGDDDRLRRRAGRTAEGQRHAAAAGDARRHRGGAARPETVPAARRLSRPAEGRSRRGDRRDIGHRRICGRECRCDRGARHQSADRLRRRAGRLDRRCAAGADRAVPCGERWRRSRR